MNNKIKSLRLERGWSQEHLAEITALSVRTIQRIESGVKPGLETLTALATVFEVSISELSNNKAEDSSTVDQHITEIEARTRVKLEMKFWRLVARAIVMGLLLVVINYLTAPKYPWSALVIMVWTCLLIFRGLSLFVFHTAIDKWQKERLQKLLQK